MLHVLNAFSYTTLIHSVPIRSISDVFGMDEDFGALGENLSRHSQKKEAV